MRFNSHARPANAAPVLATAVVAAVALAAGAAAIAVPALASTSRGAAPALRQAAPLQAAPRQAARQQAVSVPDVTASGGTPRLVLLRTQSAMTVQGFPAGKNGKKVVVYIDPGIWLASLGAPLVLDVGRSAYDKPVRVTQVLTANDGRQTTRKLPAGLLDGWNGISDMVTMTARDKAGKTVATQKETVCLGDFNVARATPDSPDNDPYPQQCGAFDPFPVGAVWGLPKNWAVDPVNFGTPLSLVPNQTYTVTETIPRTVARIFHVSAKDATSSVLVKVTGTNVPTPPPPTATPTPTASVTASATVVASSPLPAVSVSAAAVPPGARGAAPVYRLFARLPRSARRTAVSWSAQENWTTPGALPALPAAPELKNPPVSAEPDLIPLPAWGMSVSTQAKHDYLNFSATVWVGGNGPLDVEAFRHGTNPVMPAYQYFYKNGKVVGRVRAGTMGFDTAKGHDHWHFEQFAGYELLGANRKLIVRSEKVGFCIAPTDAVDMLLHGALWQPSYIGLLGQCGSPTALWVREMMPVGWGDTYSQFKAGQAFDITSVRNGAYFIAVVANPKHVLKETSYRNDISYREVILSGTKGHRHFRVLAYDGIDPEHG
jgi:hypothetical protein